MKCIVCSVRMGQKNYSAEPIYLVLFVGNFPEYFRVADLKGLDAVSNHPVQLDDRVFKAQCCFVHVSSPFRICCNAIEKITMHHEFNASINV